MLSELLRRRLQLFISSMQSSSLTPAKKKKQCECMQFYVETAVFNTRKTSFQNKLYKTSFFQTIILTRQNKTEMLVEEKEI